MDTDRYIIVGRGCGKSTQVIRAIREKLEQQTLVYVPPIQFDTFTLSGIDLSEEQKTELIKTFSKVTTNIQQLVDVMREQLAPISNLLEDLKENVTPPKQDYNQRTKPWRKDRFYY